MPGALQEGSGQNSSSGLQQDYKCATFGPEDGSHGQHGFADAAEGASLRLPWGIRA